MDIAAWLQELGLERYEQAFRDNDIDAAVLPDVTADDLIGLGVGSIGHRRKILAAISRLQVAEAVAPSTTTPDPDLERPSDDVSRRPGAERRQLTVLFCDLVGSTELAGRLDPEDMGRAIRAYQACCATVVERWEGHVAKYMGDGVLAYFGWPQAHEDDAERALHAGLDLVGAVSDLLAPDGRALTARVGIATGLVMVGDLVGEGAAKEQAVVGETPNLAARLQALAGPGQVVIAPATRQLVGGLFELVDLGAHDLKGFADPVPAWRVAGQSRAESRFEALHGEHLTPLVGREEEVALLRARWQRARDGDGQVVLLAGEPGIGKSRIVQALRAQLVAEVYTPVSHFCSPHHTNSALHPVIGLLERAAGFERTDSSEARLDKLETLLSEGTDDLAEAAPLVADLLDIPSGDRYPAVEISPERKAQRTLEVLVEQVVGLAARQPVLAVYEDVHWIDPTTLETLGLLIERIQRLPVLVLITFRPEFAPPWSGHAHVTQLSLSRLVRRDGSAMVARVSGGKPLPAEVLAEIVARTDGIPLFVEELTKTVLESGLLRDAGDHWELAGPAVPLAIPTTLHDSLMARLDRLAPVKEVAQIGAVIGREFAHRLLAAVVDRPEPDLAAALDQLIAAELIFRRGTPPEATYSFKHALVRDAAYESLLKSRRQELHARIARTLEDRFPTTADSEPEILAHHYTEAGELERAIAYWRAAAQRASERSAHQEALAHLDKGLELLRMLPESEERDRIQLQIQISLGSAFVVVDGYECAAAENAYTCARELAQELDQQAELFTATWGLWMTSQVRMRVQVGRALSDELLAVAEQGDDSARQLQAHHAAWTTLLFVPELAACRRHTEQGVALYDPERHVAHKFQYGGHDAGVCGLVHRGLAEWLLGFPDQARGRMSDAVTLARGLGHGPSLAIALGLNAYLHRFRGELAAAHEMSEKQIRLCLEQGIFPQHVAFGRIGQGWVMARTGDVEAGLVTMRRGLNELQEIKVQYRRAYHVAMFGEVCILAGRFDEARAALANALETAERWWEPEVHRLHGDLALAADADASEKAERHFRHALDLARAHESRSLELRATTSLARLCADGGDRQKAHELLAPICDWFTEGFDTADVKDAKALLDELA